ncbi:MAG: UvrD-helicase domain-containing protein [Clostridia bacterium]|nr:UvrD-helicase domain-containing protein [Clostridia bacterium]
MDSFLNLRNRLIEKDFGAMNDMQFAAVTCIKGPLLVLAGAGSGKTTVLINRIAYMIKYGDAYCSRDAQNYSAGDIAAAELYLNNESDQLQSFAFSNNPAKPWEILAITFTNKAAGELKDRIAAKLGNVANDIWAGTFHSICGKILRRYGDLLGYSSHFTIYDTDDCKRLVKELLKQRNIDEKILSHKLVLNEISHAKDKLITYEEYIENAGVDQRLRMIGEIYKVYQTSLQSADAMDFDDMIVNTVRLFEENPDVLNYYGSKFKYIMVDEYQDTNTAQYMLVKMLASVHGNICVVGDDDQSIYRFRGATIENILNFEEHYPNAKVIRLEQNYRSTEVILNAANAVIEKNIGRKGKTLWTKNGRGQNIKIHTAEDERAEAKFVADTILEHVQNGGKFSDCAVLYRMNAQTNALENVFARSGISYKVVAGHRFFERKEIKDVIAYLSVISNTSDTIRLRRIINEPKRGIGEATVSAAEGIANAFGISLYEVFKTAGDYPVLSRAAKKLADFCDMIDSLIEHSASVYMDELLDEVLQKSGYMDSLIAQGPEAQDRIENVKELKTTLYQYRTDNEEATLQGFLEEIALVSDIDSYDENADNVVLMTVHSAKGLEFENVFLVGMEEGIFPGNQSIYSGPAEIEEERRLAYVAITRAKKRLFVSKAYSRMLFGTTNRNRTSRFVDDIPTDITDVESPIVNGVGFVGGSTAINTQKHGYSNYSYSAKRVQPAAQKTAVNLSVYKPGQMVAHKTFGSGLILSVKSMSSDALLEIAFDTVGTKKIMANFAKLEIL